ncbi:hypothetical protein [Dongia sp.]|jgi:hypothetical protein
MNYVNTTHMKKRCMIKQRNESFPGAHSWNAAALGVIATHG